MLIVAPRGRTKELTRFGIPARSSTQVIVRGSVALLEAVLKAVRSAGPIALAKAHGERRPRKVSRSGSVTKAWTASASATASMYLPSATNAAMPLPAAA